GSVERVIDGKTGLLVPPDNVEALCAALLKIFTAPELATTYGYAGRQMVQEDFTWERVMEKMQLRILNELSTDE
ncbi:MAG: glycosyltransferase family 1 protein, partial [Chthoniobacterales bacterium]